MMGKGRVWFLAFLVFSFVLAGARWGFATPPANEIGVTVPSDKASYPFEEMGVPNASDAQEENDQASAIGVYVEPGVTPFTFENAQGSTIFSSASAGDAETADTSAYSWGILANRDVDNFTSSGSITSTATLGDVTGSDLGAYAQVYGAQFMGVDTLVDTFTNSCCITATTSVGDAQGESSVVQASGYGVHASGSVGSFTNNGNISTTGTAGIASGDFSTAEVFNLRGVYVESSTETFTNTGTISASATVGGEYMVGDDTYFVAALGEDSYASARDVYGVYLEGPVGTFENTSADTISAAVTVGDAFGYGSDVDAYYIAAVDLESHVESFSNSGAIETMASIGSNYAEGDEGIELYDVYGVKAPGFGSFENSGTIHVTATAGSGYGGEDEYSDVYVYDIYGVKAGYREGTVESFTNSGSINVAATAGSSYGYYTYVGIDYVYGAYFRSDVTSFDNSGEISASATVGDAQGYSDSETYVDGVYGVYFGYGVEDFSNSGSITASATAGDASGDYGEENGGPYTYAYDVYGVYFSGDVGTFENTSAHTISASATVGEASGEGAYVEATDVYGAYFDGGVESFTNSGSIEASATAGDASGEYVEEYGGAYASAYDVYGVYFGSDVGSFHNEEGGSVSASATVGSASGEGSYVEAYDVYGAYVGGKVTEPKTFENAGDISASATVGDVSGGYYENSSSDYSYGSAYKVYGVYLNEGVESFVNSGAVSAVGTVGEASGEYAKAEAYWLTGVTVNGDVDSFANSGDITTDVQMGSATGDDAWSDVYGISGVEIWGNVNSFSNSGNIQASVTLGDAEGDDSYVSTFNEDYNAGVYGVYIGNNVDVLSFENTGNITATTEAGSAIGEEAKVYSGHVLGVDIGSEGSSPVAMLKGKVTGGGGGASVVSSFVNSGTIEASATAGDASGPGSYVEVFSANPTWVDYSTVEEFTNTGSLMAGLEAGSATGDYSEVNLYDAGVGFLGSVGTFDNSGNIISTGIVGEASGDYSSIYAWEVYGVYFGGDVDTFSNSGSITASLTSDGVSKTTGAVYLTDVYGVGFDGYVGSFSNTSDDTIGASVVVGDVVGSGGEIIPTGLLVEGAEIEQNGTESYGYALVGNVYGAYFSEGAGDVTNTGSIYAGVQAGDITGYLDIGIRLVQNPEDEFYVAAMDAPNALGSIPQQEEYIISEIAPVSAVYLGGHVDSFDNQGTISTTVDVNSFSSGSWGNVYNVAGVAVVDTDTVDSLTNAGTISSSVNIGTFDNNVYVGVGNVAGIFVPGSIGSLTNTGTISGAVNVESFTNGGWGEFANVAGVYSGASTVDSLTNSGAISGSVHVNNMVNGSYMGVYGLYGTRISGPVETFDNSGDVEAYITIDSMSGDSYLDASDVNGASFGSSVETFTNSGNVVAALEAVNESGGSGGYAVTVDGDGGGSHNVSATDIHGVSFGGPVGSFSNTGLIGAFVETGDNAYISRVSGVHLGGGELEQSMLLYITTPDYTTNIVNNGEIWAEVNVGANSSVDRVGGVYLEGFSDTMVLNNGDIYVAIDPAVVDGTEVSHVAGILLEGSTATLSNPGYIHLSTDRPDADVRVVTLLNGSDATLEGPFGITFGEDPEVTQEPFYVDESSILRLNDSRVVARAGNYLKFNHPYYLIENEGEVDGTFGGLEDGTKNPYISPMWYGPDRGEDAAVIWKFDPDESTASLSLHASRTVARNILGFVTSHTMYDHLQWWVSENEERNKPIKVASSGQIASEAGPGLGTLTTKEYKNGAFFYPIYTDVEADDLGYDAHAYGLVLGVERRITNAMSVGLFGGFTTATVKFNDWDNGGKEDDQDIYHLGIFTNYACGHWYVGLTALGYMVQHDYEGKTGANYDLRETADYWSRGFEGELVGGYVIGDQKSWMVMPELGIGYSHYWMSDYKTDADISSWDREYDSEDDGYFRSIVGLTGLKRWFASETKIDLLASVRWEQALDDNDISITESIPGLNSGKQNVEEDPGDTSIVGRLGLSFTIKDRAKLNFTFRSEFNEDYTVYSGRVSVGVSF